MVRITELVEIESDEETPKKMKKPVPGAVGAQGESAPPVGEACATKSTEKDVSNNKAESVNGSAKDNDDEHDKKRNGQPEKQKSSRRKPNKTRKVVEVNEDEGSDAAEESGDVEMEVESAKHSSEEPDDAKPSTSKAGQEKESNNDIEMDDDGNPVLPEGTVIVQPESVTDSDKDYKGPEFRARSKRRPAKLDFTGVVSCTACGKQINHHLLSEVFRHPALHVLICRSCYKFYNSDNFDQDSNGLDEQCRWCGQGGNLLCCDYCSNAFCKSCVKRNMGRAELSSICDADDDTKWRCYVCQPMPLCDLVEACNKIFDNLEKYAKKKESHAQPRPGKKVHNESAKHFDVPVSSVGTVIRQLMRATSSFTILLKKLQTKSAMADSIAKDGSDKRARKKRKKVARKLEKGLGTYTKMIELSVGQTKDRVKVEKTTSKPIKKEKAVVKKDTKKLAKKDSGSTATSSEDTDKESRRTPRSVSKGKWLVKITGSKSKRKPNVVEDCDTNDEDKDDDEVVDITEDDENSDSDINSKKKSKSVSKKNEDAENVSEKAESDDPDVEAIPDVDESDIITEIDAILESESANVDAVHEKVESDNTDVVAIPDAEESNDVTVIEATSVEAESESTAVDAASEKEESDDSEKEKVVSNEESESCMIVDDAESTNDGKEETEQSADDLLTDSVDGWASGDAVVDDKEDDEKKPVRRKLKLYKEAKKSERKSEKDTERIAETSDIELADEDEGQSLIGQHSKKNKKDDEDDDDDSEVMVAPTPQVKTRGKKEQNDQDDSVKLDKMKRGRSGKSVEAKKKKSAKKSDGSSGSSDVSDEETKEISDLDKENKEAQLDLQQEILLDDDSSSSDEEPTPSTSQKSDAKESVGKKAVAKKKTAKGSTKQSKSASKDQCNVELLDVKVELPKLDIDKVKQGVYDSDSGSKVGNEKKTSRSKGATSPTKGTGKDKKRKRHGSSSSFNSDLEDEIHKLSKLPSSINKKKKQKVEEDEEGDDDKESEPEEKMEEKQTRSSRRKPDEKATKPKKDEDAESSSSSDESSSDTDVMEEDNTELDMDEKEVSMPDIPMEESDEDDENSRAKKALRAELEESSSFQSSSEDSDSTDEDKPKKKPTTKKSKDASNSNSSSSSSDSDKPKRSTEFNHLLSGKLSDKDSSDDFISPSKKKVLSGKKKRRRIKDSDDSSQDASVLSSSSSSEENSDSSAVAKKKKRTKRPASSTASSVSIDSDFEEKPKKKKKTGRKRIKAVEISSDSDQGSNGDEDEENENGEPGSQSKRKKIRKLISDQKLNKETKDAAKAELERRKRIEERQKLFNEAILIEDSPAKVPETNRIILDKEEESKKVLIEVNRQLAKKLKPHQVEAVQFMWNCVAETVKRLTSEEGSGCILAHCMGLGKSLSVITLLHTLLINDNKTKMKTALILGPYNTVLNWDAEWKKWFKDIPESEELEVYEISHVKDNAERSYYLQTWLKGGGVMIMGYEMYRNLSQGSRVKNKKQKTIFAESLVNPGPDIVVCDEGHILKNQASSISKCTSEIRTKRRVILTGTPLQNNLKEYHCMVSFVKPQLLGSFKEFSNRFMNPITNGQCADSSSRDVKLMKKRAHILHEMLDGCVQRKDYTALTKFLPPKFEYVLSVRMSDMQVKLYEEYLERGQNGDGAQTTKGARLFKDYQALMRIWTHPWVMRMQEIRQDEKDLKTAEEEDDKLFIESEESDSSKSGISIHDTSSESENDEVIVSKKWGSRTRGGVQKNPELAKKREEEAERERAEKLNPFSEAAKKKVWWKQTVGEEDQFKLELSGKLALLFEILKISEEIGDKVLLFSQSILSLDLIEDFLEYSHSNRTREQKTAATGRWLHGSDYFRMDGSTNAHTRKKWQHIFNNKKNYRARFFLISTKAGSLGINLVAANRVIVFDASWNPSYDVQSIFRAYRFGQTKPVYVYRFLAQGTMEEKIYERQVTKESLSQRVVDEHQIERHFTNADLQALYNFTPDRLDDGKEKPTPVLPKDGILAELLTSHRQWIVNYHEHDSLLENKVDEGLTEEERKTAWEEYENEKKGLIQQAIPPGVPQQDGGIFTQYQNITNPAYLTTVANMIRTQHPGLTDIQLQDALQKFIRLQSERRLEFQQQQQHLLQQQQRRHLQQQQQMQRQRQQRLLASQAQANQLQHIELQRQMASERLQRMSQNASMNPPK